MKYLLLGAALFCTPANAALPVTGKWLTDQRDATVEIGPCGDKICGRILRILVDTKGPPTDRRNSNPALRTRPLAGLVMLYGFTPNGNEWLGTIYDPKRGKAFKSKLSRNADGTLKVQGCIGFLCQSFIWTALK
jgi:uncharacterized protein (DUF2147 family)